MRLVLDTNAAVSGLLWHGNPGKLIDAAQAGSLILCTADADLQRFFRVTPPLVHEMIKTLAARGFIDREPGAARSIRLRLTRALPDLE